MRAAHRRPRGFSLIELMIYLVITLVIVAGALMLLVAQQRNYHSTSKDRELQETGRLAMGHLSAALRQAGYGVDPALVFDFGPMDNVRMDRGVGTFHAASASCNASADGVCRDFIGQPDEISFLARDPLFGPHTLTVAPAGNALTFSGPLRTDGGVLKNGQILQVMCYSGSLSWAYVQLSADSTTDSGTGAVTVTLAGASTSTDFPRQNGWIFDPTVAASCFKNASQVYVFKIDRFRYYIQSFDATGKLADWDAVGSRPYLMLDRGLSGAGPVVVAPDVEDLQFSYVYTGAAANKQVGNQAKVAITGDEAGINLAPAVPPPAYEDAILSPTRATHHPGNISAVHLSVVVRTADPDLNGPGDAIPAAGNREPIQTTDRYRRVLLETTVGVRNMGGLLPYYPSYDPTGLNDNVGGG